MHVVQRERVPPWPDRGPHHQIRTIHPCRVLHRQRVLVTDLRRLRPFRRRHPKQHRDSDHFRKLKIFVCSVIGTRFPSRSTSSFADSPALVCSFKNSSAVFAHSSRSTPSTATITSPTRSSCVFRIFANSETYFTRLANPSAFNPSCRRSSSVNGRSSKSSRGSTL